MWSSQNIDEKPEVFTNSLQHSKTLTPNPVFLQGKQLRSLLFMSFRLPVVFPSDAWNTAPHNAQPGSRQRPEEISYACFRPPSSVAPNILEQHLQQPTPFSPQTPPSNFSGQKKKSSRPDHFRDQEVTSGRNTSCIIRCSVGSCQLHKNFNRRDLTQYY